MHASSANISAKSDGRAVYTKIKQAKDPGWTRVAKQQEHHCDSNIKQRQHMNPCTTARHPVVQHSQEQSTKSHNKRKQSKSKNLNEHRPGTITTVHDGTQRHITRTQPVDTPCYNPGWHQTNDTTNTQPLHQHQQTLYRTTPMQIESLNNSRASVLKRF